MAYRTAFYVLSGVSLSSLGKQVNSSPERLNGHFKTGKDEYGEKYPDLGFD